MLCMQRIMQSKFLFSKKKRYYIITRVRVFLCPVVNILFNKTAAIFQTQ